MQEQKINEYLDKALVTGKADASNLADHILKKIDSGLQTGIEKYVNGHLRDIKQHLGEQDVKLDGLDKKIDALKVETEPAVATVSWMMQAGKVVLWISAFIASVGGAILIILKFLE